MTDPNYTAIKIVVDRSGSMQSIKSDAEGGVNAFLDSQRKAEGRRSVALAVFDDSYEEVYPSTDAVSVPAFVLNPRGSTALLDAMGRGITEFGEELAALPEDDRPGNVIFVIMTDGYENSSREWTREQIQELVKKQTDEFAWNVVYLGANQDAIAVGASLGVDAGSSLSYAASGVGVRSASATLDSYVASAASGVRASFSDEDRKSAMDNS